LPWSQQAAEEKERGNDAGQVDHESLGSSLHNIGYCHAQQGRYEEALPWFQRAVAEKEQGDVHGRVDQESLRVSVEARDKILTWLGRSNDD
jgi:tetratricopeptide (TPR) repeat protein